MKKSASEKKVAKVMREFKAGTFAQDARGRWYVTFECEVGDAPASIGNCIGIDLGLKHFAVLSDGRKITSPRWTTSITPPGTKRPSMPHDHTSRNAARCSAVKPCADQATAPSSAG